MRVSQSSRLDLLKIDVQGFEIEVLLGAQKSLQADPSLAILFEFPELCGLRQAGHRPKGSWDLLQRARLLDCCLSARW